jgi:hypothetical protein
MSSNPITEQQLHRLMNLSSYEYFGQVTDVHSILSAEGSNSNNSTTTSADIIKWNYNEKQYVAPVLKLLNELRYRKSNEFKCGNLVLYIDVKDKNAIKLVLSLLACAEIVDCNSGDYWLNVQERPYRVWEFKAKGDWNGSIGGRSHEQQFKMKQIPIPLHCIYYVIEEGYVNPKFSKGVDVWEGAAINAEVRDGFRVKHTQCTLHTIMYYLKYIKKAEEFRDVYLPELLQQPKCNPLTFKALQLSSDQLISIQQQRGFIKAYGAGRKDSRLLLAPNNSNNINLTNDSSSNSLVSQQQPITTMNLSPYVVYCRMLMVIPGMTSKRAEEIAKVYPSFPQLMKAAQQDPVQVYHTLANLNLQSSSSSSSSCLGKSDTKSTTETNKKKRKADSQEEEGEESATGSTTATTRKFGPKLAEKILTVLQLATAQSLVVKKQPKKKKDTSTTGSKQKRIKTDLTTI